MNFSKSIANLMSKVSIGSSMPEAPKVSPSDLAEEELPPQETPKRLKRVRLKELIRKTGKMTMALDRSALKEAAEKAMEAEQPVEISPTATSEELVSYALSLAKDKKVREALRVGEVAQERGLINEQALKFWTQIGNYCYDAGFMSLAAKAFRKVYDQEQTSLASVFNLGVSLHCLGHLEEAELMYEKAALIDPTHPKLCCNYGVVLFQKDQFAECESWMLRAVENEPSYVRAWDNLASAYGAQDRFEEAVKACEKAIELNPSCLEAWFKLGLIRFSAEEYSAAKMAFLQAQPLEVCQSYIYYHLGMIACQEWNDDEAEKYLRDASLLDRLCPVGPAAWSELGDFCKVQGKVARSNAAYKVAEDLEKAINQGDTKTGEVAAGDFGIKV
jgi:tetratricopeptide (TPR) repeat protein